MVITRFFTKIVPYFSNNLTKADRKPSVIFGIEKECNLLMKMSSYTDKRNAIRKYRIIKSSINEGWVNHLKSSLNQGESFGKVPDKNRNVFTMT